MMRSRLEKERGNGVLVDVNFEIIILQTKCRFID